MAQQRTGFLARPTRGAMLRAAIVTAFIGASLVFGYRYVVATGVEEYRAPRPLPAFTHSKPTEWINSPPLDSAALRGHVLLIDVWTFDCRNCVRSIPWLHHAAHRYAARGLLLIGVHTPEFEHERPRAAVERKIKEFRLTHPVMLDNDHSYWNALNNNFWPAYYLVDRTGNIRGYYVGEMHVGHARARRIEVKIEELLAEPG